MRIEDEQSIPFAIVPSEVVMDTRLTLETMRVLVTLYSFRNKNTGLTFPSREAISERCGMHPSNISEATSKLVELGWLVKAGKGGYSKSTKFTITIPEEISKLSDLHRQRSEARRKLKVAESATVAQSAMVAEQATRQVAEQATRQVAESAIRKEQTNITNKVTDNLPDESGEDTELQVACRETWKSYKNAFFARYGVDPIRNARVSAMIKNFVAKLPQHEAPHVAAFYVSHNDKFYVQKTHCVECLLKDAEGLRTQWATGKTMTATRANQLDRTASNANAIREAIEMVKAEESNATY